MKNHRRFPTITVCDIESIIDGSLREPSVILYHIRFFKRTVCDVIFIRREPIGFCSYSSLPLPRPLGSRALFRLLLGLAVTAASDLGAASPDLGAAIPDLCAASPELGAASSDLGAASSYLGAAAAPSSPERGASSLSTSHHLPDPGAPPPPNPARLPLRARHLLSEPATSSPSSSQAPPR